MVGPGAGAVFISCCPSLLTSPPPSKATIMPVPKILMALTIMIRIRTEPPSSKTRDGENRIEE